MKNLNNLLNKDYNELTEEEKMVISLKRAIDKIKNMSEDNDEYMFQEAFIIVTIEELKETIELMTSSDYKERFKAEYLQLEIRVNGLRNMLKKYKDGTLTFKPSCSYDLLNGQLKAMELYATYLDERAEIEGMDL